MPVALLELRVGPSEVLGVGVVRSEGLRMAKRTVSLGQALHLLVPSWDRPIRLLQLQRQLVWGTATPVACSHALRLTAGVFFTILCFLHREVSVGVRALEGRCTRGHVLVRKPLREAAPRSPHCSLSTAQCEEAWFVSAE